MTRTHIRAAAAGTTLLMGIVGTMAVRAFFNRPGESALHLMPADMDLVLIEDLVPAPSQVLAFARIEKTLSRNGMHEGSQNFIAAELNEDELSRAVGPYLGKSMAVGMRLKEFDLAKLGTGVSPPEGIGFVALTDPGAAAAAMKKSLKPAGGGSYVLGDGKVVRVSDDYLEIASSASYFTQVDAIINGKAKPISAQSKFMAARAMAEPGANFGMYLRSPQSHSWGVLCGSLEDAGIRLVLHGEKSWAIDSGSAYASTVSASTLRTLPSGAYMLFAMAQPAAYAGGVTKQLGSHRKSAESAFRGDFVLGMYASQKPWAGIDLLLYLGSNNGGHPADAVRDLRKEVEGKMMKGKPFFGRTGSIGKATLYTPVGDTKEMIHNIFKGPIPGVRNDVLLKGKTLAYATVGQALFVSTSNDLLKRAVAASEGTGPSIAGDADYKPFCDAQRSGSQFMLAVDLARLCAGIENTASPGNADAAKLAVQIGIATHGNAILNVSAGLGRDSEVHGRLFIPLNYARAAKMYTESN